MARQAYSRPGGIRKVRPTIERLIFKNCSKICEAADLATRPTAVKYPFSAQDIAMKGIESAMVLRGRTVWTLPRQVSPMEGRGEKEEEGRRAAEEQRVAEAAAHRALDVAVGAGGLLRDEPRRREIDARRREGDGEGIDRHDELEDAHPLRADLTGDIEVEPDAHGVHEQRGRGHDHGVEEKTLYFFHSFTTDLFDNKVYEKTAAKSPTQPFPF